MHTSRTARIARVLARVYPEPFRDRYADELCATIADIYIEDLNTRGSVAAHVELAIQLANLTVGGVIERFRFADAHSPRVHSSTLPTRRKSLIMNLAQDVRFALRTLTKQPGFSLVVILTVALGVGANTAMFSIVHGVILRALPYPDAHELVVVSQSDRFNNTQREGSSGPDYFDYLATQRAFESMAAWTGFNPTLSDGVKDPDRLTAARVTHSLFPTLGWSPSIGRGFLEGEDHPGGALVAVLSHGLWESRFGGDEGVVGRTIELNEVTYEVVGVMPPGFRFLPNVGVWVPLQYDETTTSRGQHNLGVIARLSDGVALEAGRADMTRIMADLERAYPNDNIGRGATVDPLEFTITGGVRPALWLLMGAVALVLLIACANVANLLFTRGSARKREIAVRAAIGAGTGRIVRQLLVESLTLAIAGGIVGVVIGYAGIRMLLAIAPANLPRLNEIAVSPSVLLFAFIATAVTGIAFGILPALQASRTKLTDALAEGGRTSDGVRTGRIRTALAITQVAIAFVLVVGSGLLLRSMWQLTQVDPGFRHENLVRLTVGLPATRYPSRFTEWPNAPEVKAFYADVIERATRLPSVSHAALALNAPTNSGWTTRIAIEGGAMTVEEGVEEERIRPVSAGYFETIGTSLFEGRDFGPLDRGDAPPVVVINNALARKYFPDESPLNKRLQFWGLMRTIIGVVDDVRFMGLSQPSRPAVYAPMEQLPFSGFDIILRTTTDPGPVITTMRSEIGQIDPALAVFNAASFESLLATSLAPQRFNMVMMGLFGALALTLAAVGIYGVISYGVSRRQHEFGVRVSLGAGRAELQRLVLGHGLKLALIGIFVGLAVAVATSRLIAGLLFNVGPIDPLTLGGVAVFLGVIAIIACLVPARRASRVDPIIALRQD